MVISHRYQFIYFAPKKTGSTSLTHVLCKEFEAETYGKGSADGRHDMVWPSEWRRYTTFATVRNPFTRFLSMYNFYGQDEDLRSFIQTNGCRLSIAEELASLRIDFVIRLETLVRDFHRLPFVGRIYSIPRWTISRKAKTELDDYAICFVRDRYHDDFVQFGYNPEDLSCFGRGKITYL
jgi:hypothetical protein